NSSGVSFNSPTSPPVGVNNLVDVDAQIANNSYAYWNITLDQYLGYYLTVESIFTILVNDTHSNDLDMDILFPNGTNWLSGEALTDNEIVGPTPIQEKGEYIIVIYPKTNVLGLKTILGNQVNSIRVTIVDEPTLVDNDINYDYYGSKESVYTIPAIGGPADTINVRSKTKISVRFGYINTGDDVSLVVSNSGGQVLSTTQNGTYVVFEENQSDMYSFFLGSANLSIPVFMNITWVPFEDTLSRTYEITAGNYNFLWESQTFNPDDFANSYTSFFTGYTGVSSHLENYKIYLYASSTIYLDIKWVSALPDLSDDLVRLFNYEEALTGTYSKLVASNTVDHSLLSVTISETGWYIIQVGNRALSFDDNTGDSNGDTTHVYNMDIVVNDKYDVGTNNDNPGSAVNLSPNDERIGMTDNSTTPSNDDYYRVPVSLDSRLVVDITFQYSYGVANLYVLNSSLDIVGTSIFDLQNQQHVEVLVFSTDSYFILINSTSSYDNYYDLFVNVSPIDDGYEPNDSPDQAQQLPGEGIYNLFLAKGNLDWFFISLFNGDEVTIAIHFIGSVADLNLFIYNSNGQSVGSSTSGIGDHEEVTFTAPSTDIYLIRVRGVSATFLQPGLDYQLTISVVENDDDLEPNDSSGSARPLQDGNFPELKVRAGDEDWYQIYLKATEELVVSVDFDSELGDLDLVLYDL
ncbi:MAG: pre-peptidase C-terminal domain-containing protein, partial [Candidatus Kariarchaeaceae archaeon]